MAPGRDGAGCVDGGDVYHPGGIENGSGKFSRRVDLAIGRLFDLGTIFRGGADGGAAGVVSTEVQPAKFSGQGGLGCFLWGICDSCAGDHPDCGAAAGFVAVSTGQVCFADGDLCAGLLYAGAWITTGAGGEEGVIATT